MKPIKTKGTNCILKGGNGIEDLPVTRINYTDGEIILKIKIGTKSKPQTIGRSN